MAELADAPDSKSGGKPCGFESHHRYQKIVVFEKYSNTIFYNNFQVGLDKGGLENSPVDYFPDAGYIVPPSVPETVVFDKYSNTIFLYQI